jgi:hypothetical protein
MKAAFFRPGEHIIHLIKAIKAPGMQTYQEGPFPLGTV